VNTLRARNPRSQPRLDAQDTANPHVDPTKHSEEELDTALAELETPAGSMKLIDVTPQPEDKK
jgi:hypothetical protein